jgi:3-oxoacyl-[acyl-carrier protein] reductase
MTNKERSQKSRSQQSSGLDRRDFLISGAAAGAAVAGAGLGLATTPRRTVAQQAQEVWTNSSSGRRTAVITDTRLNIGPHLAREMAGLNYNLVIADVPEGLPDELRDLGAAKVVVVPGLEQDGPNSEAKPGSLQKVVDAAGLYRSYEQNCLAVMFGLQAVLPPLMKAGRGQVVVQTSATSEKPNPNLVAYSTFRAAAAMMVRCAALTAAPKGVCVNAVGTNFMNYPGFKETMGADDPKVMQAILDMIPMGRLGETEEAAHFTLALLDGRNMYTTGNFFPVAGGFNNAGMPF